LLKQVAAFNFMKIIPASIKLQRGTFFICLMLVASSSFFAFTKSNKEITEAELGQLLFNDKILSGKQTISCASCHKPEYAFSDTVAFSKGDLGKLGKRNAPSLTNLSERDFFFFDGRVTTLEEQVPVPITDALEMNLPMHKAVERLNASTKYVSLFQKVYGQAPSAELLSKAIAAFERTLETSNSAWDRYAKGDKKAVSSAVLRGRKIFNTKGKCFDCHSGVDFTNDDFRNIGLYNGNDFNDKGRADFTQKNEDVGKFKVPGLRNVAVTAPYMHNGMFASIREVLEYYNNPTAFVGGSINTDSLLVKPLNLSKQEIDDLEAFLNSLTDSRFIKE
jgi:cytochrome c peroxidase